MVTARLAIGSVSTLALGASLLGLTPYWLNRSKAGSHVAPWGVVSALGVGHSGAPLSDDDRAQLLKLAALKSGSSPDQPGPATPPSTAPVQAVPAPAPQPAVSQMDGAPVQPAATERPAPEGVPAADAPAAEPQEQVASADPSVSSDAGRDVSAAKLNRININTASSDALDRLPGAGRIGHAIVSHRPYKNVKDLVSRRVLRMSDFQKIQSRISVD